MIYQRVRKELPNISFDTVYRTLLLFSKQGIINVVEGYGEEKRYDPDITKHHHLRCLRCSQITDFLYKDFDKLKIPTKIKNEFKVVKTKVVLEGMCKKCAGKE